MKKHKENNFWTDNSLERTVNQRGEARIVREPECDPAVSIKPQQGAACQMHLSKVLPGKDRHTPLTTKLTTPHHVSSKQENPTGRLEKDIQRTSPSRAGKRSLSRERAEEGGLGRSLLLLPRQREEDRRVAVWLVSGSAAFLCW